ncbi:MAG: AMP-binding protein [Hyphomicrobiaceae bacterium]
MNVSILLKNAARTLPEHRALSWSGGYMTYAHLNDQVGRIANALRRNHGLSIGDRVGMIMSNCPEFYPMLFGTWRAGLVAVPINAKLHAKELSWILDNVGARLAVVTPDIATRLSAETGALVPEIIETGSQEYRQLIASDSIYSTPTTPSDPDVDAWIFYTSGTTGRPKGARLSHRNLMSMINAYFADIDFIASNDTILHAAPLSHGSGLYGLAHFAKGSKNIICPGFEVDEILGCFRDHCNVSIFAAPTMIKRLVDDPRSGNTDCRGLKTIVYGGAPMYVADLARAVELFGPRFYQLYGQGEAPMTITGLGKAAHSDIDHPRYQERIASTGVPRTGCEVRVVNPDGFDLKDGEVGEIITRGDVVMKGYWKDPQATASALRDGWLWTGDMGSFSEDGYLTLKDRSKDMIISGGSNIYPREIEEVLLTSPAVKECAVIGRPHPDWGEEVVAYVVKRPGQAIDGAALDALCLNNIARFKRPKSYEFVEGLPKNNYGKVMKTEIREWSRLKTNSKV